MKKKQTIRFCLRFPFLGNQILFKTFFLLLNILFSTPDRMSKSTETKQFVLYMMYVWLFSLLLTTIVYTIDSYRRDTDNGLRTCFLDCKLKRNFRTARIKMYTPFLMRMLFSMERFSDKNSTECSYFYIPIWAIFAINQIFFTLTALKIHRTKPHQENSRQIMVHLMASRELDQNEMINEEKYVSLELFLSGNLFAKIWFA